MTEKKDAAKIDHSLKTRARSAAILAVVVLGGIYLGGIAFSLMMAFAAAIGVVEWLCMTMKEKPAFRLLTMAFGMLYIGYACGIMIWLRLYTHDGLYNTLTMLFIVWASDISAYFTGRAIGGPKLAPLISPKKTWAGFIGSSVGSALVAAILASPPVLGAFHVDTVGHMSMAAYAGIGFVLAMFGQVGDLFISIFKRRYGVKDTGTLIPGHGGILDRIDALMLVAILFGDIAMMHMP